MRNQNFSPQNLQEIPQGVAFLQARMNLQVVCDLGENFQVKWKQEWSKMRRAFFLLFLWSVRPREVREREGFELCESSLGRLKKLWPKALQKSIVNSVRIVSRTTTFLSCLLH